jgi:hypothetical protein
MKKISVVLLVLAAISAVIYYNWNRKNPSLSNMQPAFSVSSNQLFTMFEQDEVAANKQFLNKVVEVKGKVREVRKETTGEYVITLDGSDMFGIICRMEPALTLEDTSLVGEEVALKGLCTGILMDVVMVQCVFSNSN